MGACDLDEIKSNSCNLQFKLKTKPGSVATYKIEAQVPATGTISICKMYFIAIGQFYRWYG